MKHRLGIACIVTLLLVIGLVPMAGPVDAAPPPLAITPAFTGLTAPVLLTNAHDGTHRVFIVEQGGVVKVAPAGSTTTSTFLDLRPRITAGGERGLLGLAFHPSFESNGRFYVYYTRLLDGDVVISEFRVTGANPNVADPNTERVLVVIEHSQFANHNGGMIEFGPDGRLYAGVGDGGAGNDPNNNGQNPNSPLGKVHRIDVDSLIPIDDIHAIGLRNPWRFSFDRADGRLILGDVGQSLREEIDIITAGANYGWRTFEGTQCTGLNPAGCLDGSPFTFPITEYGHTGGRCSVTGGYVYRGSGGAMPQGTYVYGDYCSGEIFVIEGTQTVVARDTNFAISSFGEDEAGELYVVNLGGTIHKFVPGGQPQPDPCQPPQGIVSGPLNDLGEPLATVAGVVCPLGL